MHHFISYSHVDAADLIKKLIDCLSAGPPEMQPWIDTNNLHSGHGFPDWDTQINNAIRTCDSLIFMMTRDSVEDNSECKREWSRALRYKKPVIPILLHTDAEIPYRLEPRHYIDFSVRFEDGCTALKKDILWGQTPEGQLQTLKYRLVDAKRDLRRANDAVRARVEKEIEELTLEINNHEKTIQSPAAAVQFQQSIQARIEIERQPLQRVEMGSHAKFINQPPMFAPLHFQDRYVETGIIADFLKTDSHRMITLVGRGGIGKTAMVCRLLKSLEQGLLPDDRGKFETDGIIYLHESGTHKIGFGNLFEDLCRLLPPNVAKKYEQIYKDGQRPVHTKIFSLLEEFHYQPVIVLLDNLETFIDPETRSIIPEDLKDALRALLEAPHHTVKVIITTRIPPQDLFLIQPGRQKILPLEDGLGYPHAENILRALDTSGILGLRDAPDTVLNKVRENTRGFPRALEAFSAVLAADRSTTLEELLTETQNALPEYVVEKLVGEAFSRLNKNAQMVMQALAIFGRPVPSVAVDFLLQPYIGTPDSVRILNNLVNMYFVRREQGRYYMHPVDLAYAMSLVPPDSKMMEETGQVPFSQRTLRRRASEYFRQIRRPRNEWKNLADIEPQLAEFELRCAAGDYETALMLVNEIDDDYLSKWGHAGFVVEMRQKLLGKLTDEHSECRNLTGLGNAFLKVGKSSKAIEHNTHALHLSEKINHHIHIAVNLNSLAIAYRRLGQISKAIEMYERSLIIDRKISRSEATTLGNLAVAYRYLGDLSKSVDFHEQSLVIQRRDRDIRNEGWSLGIQAVSFRYLGKLQKAIDGSTRALQIVRDEKDRYWEAYHLAELGSSYLDLGDVSKGSELLESAIKIAQETADSHFEAVWAVRLGVKELLFGDPSDALDKFKYIAKLAEGNENSQYEVDFRLARAMAELRSERLEVALNMIEPILQTEYRLHLPEIMALKGIALLRQKKIKEAEKQFNATIKQADNLLQQTAYLYTALEAKGVADCGLAICAKTEEQQYIALAVKCYRQAREIVTADGVVKRALFFFDECAKADNRGILSSVQSEVKGRK
ncbi:MAG: toll/interleukin-1 receptor domain-containing protein [Methanoregula sp.]|jgi:tetratricopeptide (TPR) repeat protein|nr:toll/interleukin-1 receptor domain-containing protein [Methanoregula sp.]